MINTPSLPRDLQSLADTIEIYSTQRPQLKTILQAFTPLFQEREKLTQRFFAEAMPPLSPIDTSRWETGNNGIPILADVSLAALKAWLEISQKTFLPILQTALSDSKEIKEIITTFQSEKINIIACLEGLFNGDDAELTAQAKANGVHAGLLYFVLSVFAAPIIEVVGKNIEKQIPERFWQEGFCPVCGNLPSFAVLSRIPESEPNSLVGGGGKKFLNCSFCGHIWSFRRDACPACQNTKSGTREVFFAHKAKQEKIEVCSECKTYLPCIDLREYFKDPNPLVVPLGLIHLNIIAHQKGYTPLVPTPWNSF